MALLAIALAAHVVWDNQRLVVTEWDVTHAQLPAEFDGFRIVQVSDLHGKRFGEQQELLARAIADARPDIILLTGDYADVIWPTEEEAFTPLGELLAALPADVPAYYVLGNWDEPISYGSVPPTETLAVRFIESRGIEPAHPAVRIEREGASIWLHDWEALTYGTTETAYAQSGVSPTDDSRSAARHRRFADAWLFFEREFVDERDFGIAVTHRPLDFEDYDWHLEGTRAAREQAFANGEEVLNRFVDWDVNIAGHTHAGQYRIPGYGGLVSPSMGMFPDQDDIYGVSYDSAGRALCVSAGLGAGGPIPWLRFRLFNPGELTVYTLRRQAS